MSTGTVQLYLSEEEVACTYRNIGGCRVAQALSFILLSWASLLVLLLGKSKSGT